MSGIKNKKRLVCLAVVLSLVILLAVILSIALLPSRTNHKSYTKKIWDANHPSYQKILALPFIRGVSNGTLDEKVFRNYIIQDYLFLQSFRKAYETLLPKAPDEKGQQLIAETIKGIDEEIKAVHAVCFRKYSITNKELSDAAPNTTTVSYDLYLTDTATREPFEVGLIATLPCHWIYYEVGVDLKKAKQVAGNPYQEWIDEYGSISWEESEAKAFVNLVEYYMEKAPENIRKKMEQAYKKAAGLEYMFWDTVYRDTNLKSSMSGRGLFLSSELAFRARAWKRSRATGWIQIPKVG